MEYFYAPPQNISSNSIEIDGEEFSHLTHVMRKQAGDKLRIVDGAGNAYDVVLIATTQRTARCAIQALHPMLHEPAIDLTLAVGVLKNNSNFDFLVEKCTELGVNTIVPLFTERTIPHHAKTERWKKLALAAMKQCGRCVLPEVTEPKRFSEFIAALSDASLKIIPHEKVKTPGIVEALENKTIRSIVVCIGPEGGFSDDEIEAASRTGFLPVSLGIRRLRTETAAIVACAAVIGMEQL